MGTGNPPSIEVIQQIAAADGVDPANLDPPLYEVIDPDALDALAQSISSSSGTHRTGVGDETEPAVRTIEFSYRGYLVRVDNTGSVDVTTDRLTDSNVNSTEDAQSD